MKTCIIILGILTSFSLFAQQKISDAAPKEITDTVFLDFYGKKDVFLFHDTLTHAKVDSSWYWITYTTEYYPGTKDAKDVGTNQIIRKGTYYSIVKKNKRPNQKYKSMAFTW